MDAEPEPATWSGIADWYDRLVRAGSGPHELAVENTLPIFFAARVGKAR